MKNETKRNALVAFFLFLTFSVLFTFSAFYYMPIAAAIAIALFLVIWYTFFHYFEKWK